MAITPAPIEFYQMPDLPALQNALQIPRLFDQLTYIYQYLRHHNISTIIVEPYYFDRDYLSEFSAFYSLSAKGYPNHCRRAHFFSEEITRAEFEDAVGGAKLATEKLQRSYQGFSVIRPIESAPFGRTVLAWYPENYPANPRVVKPSREYSANLCGIKLSVFGLAWQQQDQGVSACATVGLWTMLHSSAFNERYAIPTTVAITQAANHLSWGLRTFPSRHLFLQQVCEAIKGFGLSPYLVDADQPPPEQGMPKAFSKEKLCNTLASLIRSGFPCVLGGMVKRPNNQAVGGHINACVGFRAHPTLSPSQMYADGDLMALYIHDDNIGPAVRFTIGHYDPKTMARSPNPTHPICLAPDNPTGGQNIAATNYGFFIPNFILAAVENDLRTSAEALIQKAIDVRDRIATAAFLDATNRGQPLPILTVGTQYSTIADYIGGMLHDRLYNQPKLLAATRLTLLEQVEPMSLYVGIVRIAEPSGTLIDVLYDTTDSDINHPIFATICYTGSYAAYVRLWDAHSPGILGKKIIFAY